MSEFFVGAVKIEKVEKHPNADTLDVVTVLGDYPVISKLGLRNAGDLVGYASIDAIVPDVEQFHFLAPAQKVDLAGNIIPTPAIGSVPEKYRRIKAKKLRGIYSQGLLFDIPQEIQINEGDSLFDLMGFKRYDEEQEENLPFLKTRGANAEAKPDWWIFSKYDIESLRKYLGAIQEDEEYILTEKLNGSNACFIHDSERIWCRSRNYFKRQDDTDMWWGLCKKYDLEIKLKQYPMLAFYGECYGQVKGFKYDAQVVNGMLSPNFAAFDIMDVKTGRYLDHDAYREICKNLDIPVVPELWRGKWTSKEEMYMFAEGKSTLNNSIVREGFCIRGTKERFEERLQTRFILKLVGEGYNLTKK